MKLPLAVLAIGIAVLLVGTLAFLLIPEGEHEAVREAQVESAPVPHERVAETAIALEEPALPAAATDACEGVPGPAPDPLGGTVSLALKEAAISALIRRNHIYLSNDVDCIRAYMADQLVVLEARAKFLTESDETIVSSATFFASLLPIPDPDAFRAQMLGEETEWFYQEGELSFMTDDKRGGDPGVTATYEDGTPAEIEFVGTPRFGSTVNYRNRLWY